MKKYLKHLLILAAIIAVCIALNPTKAQADSVVDKSLYYGRQQLTKMSNSTALLYAYDQIEAGVENSAQKITIYNGRNAISETEMKMVFDLYIRDHAHHFWVGKSYRYTYNSRTCLDITPSYIMSGSQLKTAKKEFEQAADAILAGITPDMSEYERELYLHDTLAEMITYTSGDNAHDAYGALVTGKVVCEGYAEAFQYLLQRAGIQSFLAVGYGIDTDGTAERHEWNYVRIDGKYYQVDLTWDDPNDNLFHAYFNQTDAVMGEDHIATETAYPLPVCKSTTAQYFTGKDTYLKTYTAETVGNLLKNNQMTVNVYIPGDVNAFLSWYKENIRDIAKNANVPGAFTYRCSYIGREVRLTIEFSCNHVNAETITKATLSKAGSIVKKCTVCGKVENTTTIKSVKTVTLSATSYVYNGTVKTPTVTVKDSAGKTLTKGTDYTVTYPSGCKNAGSYTVTVKGMGNYSFTKTLTFKINPVNISYCSVKLSSTSYTYNGKVKAPTVTVKTPGGSTLTKGTSYTVTYSGARKNIGTYSVKVTMKGNYTGTKTLTFKINPIKASNCSMKLSATGYTYNGGIKTPTVKIVSPTGATLTQGTSYTVTYSSGRKLVGTYTVKVTMKGNYTGTRTLTFKINPIKAANCSMKLSATSYTYNGKVKTPTVTVKSPTGAILTKGTSYTVTYASGRKNVGTYSVKVTMKGNYTGTKTLTFKINPKTPLAITQQPKSVAVAMGEIARVPVKATGEGLTYAWYVRDVGDTKDYLSSNKTSTYKMEMSKANAGRKAYCVITDKYGNSVKTNTVTLSLKTSLKITQQPKSVAVAEGEIARVPVKATGEGLTYAWYVRDVGDTKDYLSSNKTSTYKMEMSKANAGRKAYCVITDKYGNSVRTNTITISMKK